MFARRARARWYVLVISVSYTASLRIATLEDLDAQSEPHGVAVGSAFFVRFGRSPE